MCHALDHLNLIILLSFIILILNQFWKKIQTEVFWIEINPANLNCYNLCQKTNHQSFNILHLYWDCINFKNNFQTNKSIYYTNMYTISILYWYYSNITYKLFICNLCDKYKTYSLNIKFTLTTDNPYFTWTLQAIYCTNLPSLLKVFVHFHFNIKQYLLTIYIPANEVHA